MGVKRVVDYAVKVRIQPDKAGTPQATAGWNNVTAVYMRRVDDSVFPSRCLSKHGVAAAAMHVR